jgi:hypothetical protein
MLAVVDIGYHQHGTVTLRGRQKEGKNQIATMYEDIPF